MDKIKFFFSGAYDFLKPFIKILLTRGGVILMMAAKETVAALAENMKDAEGTEKQKVALNLISTRLKNEGIDMATAAINQAIEAAVLKLKER